MTNGNPVNRRRFLRTTAAGVVGLVGGAAATGTTAADEHTPGNVTVSSRSNNWCYEIHTSSPFAERAPVCKNDAADASDEITEDGLGAIGSVWEGNEDSYWFPDVLTDIVAIPDGMDSRVTISVGSTAFGDSTLIEVEGDGQYEYAMEYLGEFARVGPPGRPNPNGPDNAAWVSGTVEEGSPVSYIVTGHLYYLRLSDPTSSTDDGLRIEFMEEF